MGVYAETSIEIICETEESAKKVKKAIIKAKTEAKEEDEFNYNYANLNLAKGDTVVYLDKSSGRIQNLKYQCNKLWTIIKDIKGVEEMNCPFMSETDGTYYSNEE